MNKRMREIQAQITKILESVETLKAEKKFDEAAAKMDEIDALQKEFDLEERTEAAKKAGVPKDPKAGVPGDGSEKVDGVKALADAARARFKTMNEGAAADGGYTVPVDVQTMVNKYKEEKFSLRSLIDEESVTTMSGKRTYQTRAQHTGFTEVGEGGKVGKKAGPKYEILDYKIKKYAGYLPVTNELLEDSDANISNEIVQWLGEEEVATENNKILAAVALKATTDLKDLNGIKKAVNVTLSAFRGSVKIITNSDGINYLDTLEDKNGRPLLSPNPKEPMQMSLSIGARSVPVVEVPNDVLATAEGGAIPFIIGDLHSYVKMFDRKQLTLTVSDIASVGDFNAFEEDLTLFRAIMRADFKVKDSAAIVNGTITPAV